MVLAGLLLLIMLGLALLLPTLVRRHAQAAPAAAGDGARRANLAVLREQLVALDAERAAGGLDDEQHRAARGEIERRALEEEQGAEQPVVQRRAAKTAWALGISLPLFVVVVYALVGNPQALVPQAASMAANPGGEVTGAQIEAMVEKLAQRMEGKAPEPGDEQGWMMLARSYAVLQRYPEASRAYARARALLPDNAQLLADHADVIAMTQNQSLVGEPTRLVQRALQLDPKNIKALALAGSAAFERKDFAGALAYWTQAQPLATPGSEFAAGLESSIQQARTAQGAGGGAAAAPAVAAAPAIAAAPAAAAVAANSAGQSVSGVVQVAPALAAKVAPTDTVFIFARAAEGPRMPLAILKRRASELPITFSLDDSTAMSPDLKLSKFSSVIVGARISRSGDAMPKSGDLTGQLGPVAAGSGKLTVTIDAVQP